MRLNDWQAGLMNPTQSGSAITGSSTAVSTYRYILIVILGTLNADLFLLLKVTGVCLECNSRCFTSQPSNASQLETSARVTVS